MRRPKKHLSKTRQILDLKKHIRCDNETLNLYRMEMPRAYRLIMDLRRQLANATYEVNSCDVIILDLKHRLSEATK